MSSGTPRRRDVDATAGLIGQAGHQLERSTQKLGRSPEALIEVREALLAITATSARLARQLDGLVAACKQPANSTEPSAVHVALDQAAAAAEDLGNCTKVAAQAIYDGE